MNYGKIQQSLVKYNAFPRPLEVEYISNAQYLFCNCLSTIKYIRACYVYRWLTCEESRVFANCIGRLGNRSQGRCTYMGHDIRPESHITVSVYYVSRVRRHARVPTGCIHAKQCSGIVDLNDSSCLQLFWQLIVHRGIHEWDALSHSSPFSSFCKFIHHLSGPQCTMQWDWSEINTGYSRSEETFGNPLEQYLHRNFD